MRIYFLTRQPDVCQLLADRLLKLNAEIKIFPLIPGLFHHLFDLGILPDVLFLDFLYYQNDGTDFYNILKKYNTVFPVVFYNHPFPIPERRHFFWSYNLKKTGFFTDLASIDPILQLMEESLMDPDISPYVSCIQEHKTYKSDNLRYIEPLKETEFSFYLENFDNVITDHIKENKNLHDSVHTATPSDLTSEESNFTAKFQNTHHLSHNIFTLFKYLYSKRNTHVALDELTKILSKGNKSITANGIRLSIHRLRAILKQDITSGLEILNYNYGYSLIEKDKIL